MSTTAQWVVVLGGSAISFAIKYAGYRLPARWLAQPRWQRINALVPIVLLSALVVAQSVVRSTHLVIDHRLAGVAAAIGALLLRAPFPVVVIFSAVASAVVYHLH